MPPEGTEIVEDKELDIDLDDADASSEAEKSADATSSSAADAKEPEGSDTASVVRDVVDKRKQPEAASSADGEEGDKPESKTTKELDNENFTDVPFHKHPRFQTVIGELKTAKVDQQRYRNVEAFLDQQGLTGNEAAGLLEIGGLIKTNPAEAWKRMKPVVEKVLVAAGELLPADLKAKVDSGDMPRDVALEVSRSRAAVNSTKAQGDFERQRAEVRQRDEAQSAILGTVSTWESDRRQRDPNFDAKQPALQREIAFLHATEGKPKTIDGIRQQLQKAYDTVSKSFTPPANPRQQRPPLRPVTGGQVNGNARPEINSTLDAIRAVTARRAG